MQHRANGVTHNVLVRGESASPGPVIVFLHYFGGSSRAWIPVIEQLESRFRCIAPDLRGFGDTEAPATGYSVADYADDIAALVEELSLQRYVLVGHSMGGKIALMLASRRTENLVSLVLLAPSPPTPEPITDRDRERLLRGHGRRTTAEETINQATATPLTPALFEQAVEDNVKSSPAGWEAWLNSGSREVIVGQMPGVALPVLIASGTGDTGIPTALLNTEVLDRLTDARLITMPGVGHLSPLEAPALVADIIASWAAA